ncbi:MAG: hypothetical protein ACXWC4_19580 [Telluria sp.]
MHRRLCLSAAVIAALGGCASDAPRAGYYITPYEMTDVYGTYVLSNGDTLRITREHRRYWAEMTRTGRVEIVPVAHLVFVERAGALRYTFTTGSFDTKVHIEGTAPPNAYAAVLGSASNP